MVSGQLDRAASDRYQALDDLMEQIELCQDNLYPASCARGYAGAYVDARQREADAFLSMLLHVVRSVAPIPDAKAVVLFSNGFTRTPEADAMDASRFVLGDDTIDRMLFSPVKVTVTALESGESFEGGHIDTAILSRSFSS